MITNFKIFEKLGIDKIVYDITEKVWKDFLRVYDEKKAFSDKVDNFKTDISDLDYINFIDFIGVNIVYNIAYSQAGFPMTIGVIDRNDNTKIKKLQDLKNEIIHEVQHNIYSLRKYGKIKNHKSFKKKEKKEFLDKYEADAVVNNFIFPAFNDKNGNIYRQQVSINNFLKYNKFSETFKKLITYIYLAEDNEMSSKIHEFLLDIKNSKDFSEVLEYSFLKQCKEMSTFKMNISDFTEDELKKLKSLFELKNMKKVQKYINMKGENFIKKVHKLSYFKDSEIEL